MQKPLYTLFSLLFLFTFFSCNHLIRHQEGNGNIISQNIKVDEFDEIDVGGNYEVLLISGKDENVELETDENLMDFIEIYTHNHRLVIHSLESLHSDHGIKVYVTYRNLSNINSSGASKVKTDGVLRSDDIDINMSGAGLLELDLDCKALDMDISGAGLVRLSGVTNRQHLQFSGAGKLDAFNLRSRECYLDLSGVGAAEVYVTDLLDASVSGIGGIKYRGNPQKVNQNVSGLGKVTRDGKYDDNI